MATRTWPIAAVAAAAVTIACGAFAVGAAMSSDSGGGAAATPSASRGAAVAGAVVINNFAFVPADVSVAAGTTVSWTNDDDVTHNVFSADSTLGSPDLGQGDVYEVTLDQPGTLDYYCDIHQSMTGTITVGP